MKTSARIAARLALAATIAAPVAHLAGHLALADLHTALLVATLVWFVAAPFARSSGSSG
ncbi:MAG: hypothetical protein IPM29_26240 [Planctomycetes bacterium]|nr:hypothetical protein [Planctomycetota bacterium]